MFRWWRRRLRNLDKKILWPSCRDQASTLQDARGAFYVHCMMDSAWTKDLTEDQIIAECEQLC